jgi:hypothetical protein
VKTPIRLGIAAVALALPILAVPLASAASAAPVVLAAPTPTCTGNPHAPDPTGSVEGLIGNVSPAAGSTVAAGSTISFLVADEQSFPQPLSGDAVVTVNGAAVTATVGAQESGVPISYFNPSDKGSQSTNCEIPVSAVLPSNISGSAQVCATAYDGDQNRETVCWTLSVQPTPVPIGAIGGIGVAAVAGLVLFGVQMRRRRHSTMATGS